MNNRKKLAYIVYRRYRNNIPSELYILIFKNVTVFGDKTTNIIINMMKKKLGYRIVEYVVPLDRPQHQKLVLELYVELYIILIFEKFNM